MVTGKAEWADAYVKPFGTIFLNLIKFIVVPIVLASIIAGEKGKSLANGIQSLCDVSMIIMEMILKLSPIEAEYYFCVAIASV